MCDIASFVSYFLRSILPLSISISRDATNCEIGSNIVKNATNVTNVKNVRNVRNVKNVRNVRNVRNFMNAAGEKAGERVKKDEGVSKLRLWYTLSFIRVMRIE